MTKQKDDNQQVSIKVGNISGISGAVNLAGGNITTYPNTGGLSAAEIEVLFQSIYTQLEARPQTPAADQQDLKAELQEVQAAVTQAASKNEKMDENSLGRRFRNIARMAPDILDVVAATLANPLAGMGVAIQKVAQKAKEDAGSA